MPHTKVRENELDKRLGIKLLLDQQRYYRLLQPGTPIVVFTGHPTYKDSVECIKAGAEDYLLKPGKGGSMEVLVKRCSELLRPPRDPLRLWFDRHIREIVREYAGKYVSVVDADTAARAGLKSKVVAGHILIPGDSVEQVRHKMLKNKKLRWEKPSIFKVPGRESELHGQLL